MPASTQPTNHAHITDPFISTLHAAIPATLQDDPNYYATTPSSLLSTSTIHNFTTGTGDAIYRSLSDLLSSVDQELILVTCFWARSSTLDNLKCILRFLSEKALSRRTLCGKDKIRVRICFSSSSLFQKLFHAQSVTGQTYEPSVWTKKLGLPDPKELAGLDLQVKSVFLLPFSVMHPKFIIVDRATVVLPSCNVSWEAWFEGAITVSGPVVQHFLRFYTVFWERGAVPSDFKPESAYGLPRQGQGHESDDLVDHGHSHVSTSFPTSNIPTIFLPSSHRRNPHFRPFTAQDNILAPPTPLNTFLLTLFAKASKSIRIQTPNLTAPPVLSSLLNALARGVDVQILTSEGLMVWEQLGTAGTTTTRCVARLVRRYKRLSCPSSSSSSSRRAGEYDEEAALRQPGRLRISYFAPLRGARERGEEGGEPQQSHLKMTIVDNEVLVLGSGNLDRASWFTSQELGVAFFGEEVVGKVTDVVDKAMEGRGRCVFDSQA